MIRFAMDKRYEEALLFDFYGELLTDKQKAVFEEAYVYDCSLSEIAEEHGISRQGVHDMLKRSQKTLADYEAMKISGDKGESGKNPSGEWKQGN